MSTDAGPAVTTVEIDVDGGRLPIHVWHPRAGSGPGILLVQEIFGVSPYVRDRAADLAAAGYLVHVPDLYWRLGETPVDESAPDVLTQGMARMQRLPWEDAVADTTAALQNLRASTSDGVGMLGLCYGGGIAFAVAASEEIDALVCYYGSALPQLLDLAPSVTAPSLHHFGESDSFIPMETVEEIRDAVVRDGAELFTYPGAGHAFDNTRPEFHHPEATELAWQRTTAFLAEHLPVA